jgi:hypothetical protein
MRYRLRTLLILLTVLPPVLALCWWYWQWWRWAVVVLALTCLMDVTLPLSILFHGFGALCRLAGGKRDDKPPTRFDP